MPRRRGGTSAGRPPPASRRWYARWSTPIWRLSPARCSAATAMTDAGAITDARYSLAGKRVWVAGLRGPVGIALVRRPIGSAAGGESVWQYGLILAGAGA